MILLLILTSLAGLAYFVWTDPKRRRIHKQAEIPQRRTIWLARIAVIGPGVWLLSTGHWSGLTIWAGALTTLGWAMAAIPPDIYAKRSTEVTERSASFVRTLVATASQIWKRLSYLRAKLSPFVDRSCIWLSEKFARHIQPRLAKLKPVSTHKDQSDLIATLETRIKALEARIEGLEQAQPNKVVQLGIDAPKRKTKRGAMPGVAREK